MKQHKGSFMHLGFSSVLMVLTAICLITFAMLSVATAHTDYQLSKKNADNAQNYYTADMHAREALSIIDSTLFVLYENTDSSEAFNKEVLSQDFINKLPQTVSNVTIEQTDLLPVISYEVPVSTTQTLHVSLKIQYPQTDSEYFTTIVRWQTVTEHAPDKNDN